MGCRGGSGCNFRFGSHGFCVHHIENADRIDKTPGSPLRLCKHTSSRAGLERRRKGNRGQRRTLALRWRLRATATRRARPHGKTSLECSAAEDRARTVRACWRRSVVGIHGWRWRMGLRSKGQSGRGRFLKTVMSTPRCLSTSMLGSKGTPAFKDTPGRTECAESRDNASALCPFYSAALLLWPGRPRAGDFVAAYMR